jgi:hypothetical protein
MRARVQFLGDGRHVCSAVRHEQHTAVRQSGATHKFVDARDRGRSTHEL